MLKKSMILALLASLAVVISGCTETGQFKPAFSAGDVETYRVVQETTKEVSFEQPSLNKSKLDTTKSVVEVVFEQKAVDVAQDGGAVFDITIEELKLYSKGQQGVNHDYDSSRDADKNSPLSRLIGQSYKIRIAPDGKASVVDASAIRSAGSSREARALTTDEAIEKRHSIMAMPKDGEAVIAQGKGWTTLGSTPKGALQPKAFEKSYSLDAISDTPAGKIALVKMKAAETNQRVEGFDANSGGLGVMANIFDSVSNYNGSLKYNLTTGKIVSYEEKLVSEHTAAEEPRGGDSSKGPDVLTMRFINSYSITAVK
jgi:hypothetical protein